MTYEHPADPESILIYPEIVGSNPDNHPRFVRWLLNTAIFPDDPCWGWEENLGADRLLTVNVIEPDLWKDRGRTRSGVAYWVGKGVIDTSLIPEGAQEISRSNWPDRSELANYVAGLDHLISFDPFTSVVPEALISGTPVLIHASKSGKGEQKWMPYGVAWGDSEMEWARLTIGMARQHYLQMLPVFDQRIDSFIHDTQEMFP